MRGTSVAAPVDPARLYVGQQSDFVNNSRQLIKHGVRNIAVVLHDDKFYAFDNACYHHGGALLRGDIEDMGGHPCIVCPWHSYRIAMDTGEGLYVGVELNPGGGAPVHKVKSKGQKQRVYPVSVEADGRIFVEFDATGPKMESDTYAGMAIANQEAATVTPLGSDGAAVGRGPRLHSGLGMELRSGHVFQAMRANNAGSGLTNGGDVGGGARTMNLVASNRGGLSGVYAAGRGGLNPLRGHASTKPVSVTAGEEESDTDDDEDGKAPANRHGVGSSSGVSGTTSSHLHGKVKRSSDPPKGLAVSCALVEDVCEGVKQFSFICHSGTVQRNCERGEYVELELPIRGPNGQQLRRKWTVSDTNHRNTFFSIVVKRAGADAASSGSAWLHQYALHVPLRVCRVGGTFTMVDHNARIRAHRGQVLWLTAGIGITSAYASITAALTDDYFVHSTQDPLSILHLHVDRHLDGVAKLRELAALCARFPSSASATPRTLDVDVAEGPAATKCYTLQVHLTREVERARPASGSNGEINNSGRTGLSGESRSSGKRSKKEQVVPLAELTQSLMRAPSGVRYSGRYQCEGIAAAAKDAFGGSGNDCVAFVCGPPSFVEMCTSALLSIEVAEDDILTDDP